MIQSAALQRIEVSMAAHLLVLCVAPAIARADMMESLTPYLSCTQPDAKLADEYISDVIADTHSGAHLAGRTTGLLTEGTVNSGIVSTQIEKPRRTTLSGDVAD